MGNPITLTSDQKIAVGATILDKGGEAFTTVPPGYMVSFVSSDPSVVGVVVRPDGLNADLSSDNIGVSMITVSVQDSSGAHLMGSPDVTEITVAHAEPGSANITFGAPEPEVP